MKKSLVLALFAGGLLASCSNNEEVSSPDSSGTALGVKTASVSTIITRASTELNADASTIGVYRLAVNTYAAVGPVSFTYDGTNSVWNYTNGVSDYIYLNNSNASVCAVSPYTASVTDPSAIVLTSQADAADKDLVYSGVVSTVNKTTATATFADMEHAYSKITFSITKDETYGTDNTPTDPGVISQIALSGAELNNTASLSISGAASAVPDGVYSSQVSGSPVAASGLSLTMPLQADVDASTATPVEQSFLMVPVDALTAAPITVTFTIDGNDYTASVTPGATPFDTFTSLTAGTNYQFNVLLSKGTALQITSVTVVDWVDQASGDLEPTASAN
ncbi:MAG: fimbrillin family protein [Bacteroides sp.]|jgi:hypothetical protein|nr:fimbrillin family protein [Bacteroides sp.]